MKIIKVVWKVTLGSYSTLDKDKFKLIIKKNKINMKFAPLSEPKLLWRTAFCIVQEFFSQILQNLWFSTSNYGQASPFAVDMRTYFSWWLDAFDQRCTCKEGAQQKAKSKVPNYWACFLQATGSLQSHIAKHDKRDNFSMLAYVQVYIVVDLNAVGSILVCSLEMCSSYSQ